MGARKMSKREWERVKVVELRLAGKSIEQIQALFDVSRRSIDRWVARHKQGGEEALAHQYPTRQGKLTEEQWQVVDQAVLSSALDHGFEQDFWSLPRLCTFIHDTFEITMHPSHLSKVMRQRGFSWQKPVRQHPDSNEDAKRTWVEQELPRLEKKSSGG